MSFLIGDIPFFKEYQFTDTGKIAPHYGLVLLPETATRWKGSLLCCVVTSSEPKDKHGKKWSMPLLCSTYDCFDHDSYAFFNRKDLVSMSGLGEDPQPKARLNKNDMLAAFKKLKHSLYAIKDIANDSFMRGAIIYRWKKELGLSNFQKVS